MTGGERPVEPDVVLGGAGRLAGSVLTADGPPVRNAIGTLANVPGEVAATTRSGREGGCGTTGLVAGEHTLAASVPAFRPAVPPVTVQAARETRQDVEPAGGAVPRGTVRGSAGRAVEDARVTLLDAAGNVVATLTTGPDGIFRFVDLSSGEHTVVAAGYPPVATVLQVAGGDRTERDLQLGHGSGTRGGAGNGRPRGGTHSGANAGGQFPYCHTLQPAVPVRWYGGTDLGIRGERGPGPWIVAPSGTHRPTMESRTAR
ncbi:hypothetical protein GCM10027073_26800 [Streptomyces chlorus]